MLNQLTYKQYGNRAILIEWPAIIDEHVLKDILTYKEYILKTKKKFIEECITGYNSLTIIYLKEIIDFSAEKKSLIALYSINDSKTTLPYSLWEIPVCYDKKFGIDLEEMSASLNLSGQEIVDLHSEKAYNIYLIGFLPGFLYLGGLPPQLETNRKSNPRIQVEKGSVAIGGKQTGIYPMDSAGGWHIIGKTPLSLFNVDHESPCFARPGDKIKFTPITLEEFKKVKIEVQLGVYEPSKIKLNG